MTYDYYDDIIFRFQRMCDVYFEAHTAPELTFLSRNTLSIDPRTPRRPHMFDFNRNSFVILSIFLSSFLINWKKLNERVDQVTSQYYRAVLAQILFPTPYLNLVIKHIFWVSYIFLYINLQSFR